MTEPVNGEVAALVWEHTRKRALILEAQRAYTEAAEAQLQALSLVAYKQTAFRAALDGGVKATELALATGLSRERVYLTARRNKKAGKKMETS